MEKILIVKLVISFGHGKYVSGANSYINEVTEARRIVSRVVNYLEKLGCTVYEFHDNTTKTQNENIQSIIRYHNSKIRDLDVSIHLNAASKTNDPRGVEVLYVSENGRKIAKKVSDAIAKVSGLKNRGAKKRTHLGFLKGTEKPAILIEVCFVDSKADVVIYKSKFNEICKAIAESISGKKLPEPKPNPGVSVQIRTGGLSPEMVAEIGKYFDDKK
ncbi:N-acetylmuramoyl-L-alanine amidase [Bacillus sp. SA1-12]|uniref:N-acetylmuramoyl-L-alanine amidase n=1 Tax=Bacillus sp. SA1-12 TaxID=1455638 RepID=UPI000698C885|nr:N-acetylmuramoyl-L-alanine amidase [Bacillus sp. SA1-12]